MLFGAPGLWSIRRCRNTACGLIWLDPQPIEEDIGLAYARYHTHESAPGRGGVARRAFRRLREAHLASRLGYARARPGPADRLTAMLGALFPGGGEALSASAMFLPAPGAGSTLLDVGCGAGDFMAFMRGLGWRVHGVETDPHAVERARGRGLDVQQGDLASADLPDAAFDAVTLAHVIEHVHDAARLLGECRRIMKPDGRLVLLTPNSRSWGHRHFGRDWRGLEPPRHIRVFNAGNIGRLLDSAGLRAARIATLAINAAAVWRASMRIRAARSGSAAGADGRRSAAEAIARQVAERALLRQDPDAGEDLLVVATRA